MDMYSPKTPEMFMKYYQIHACTHIYFLITIIKKGAERRGVRQEDGHACTHIYFLITIIKNLFPNKKKVLREEGLDKKMDIYSFAIALWEMLTCQLPWCQDKLNQGQDKLNQGQAKLN